MSRQTSLLLEPVEVVEAQIEQERRFVDYDTTEFTAELIIEKLRRDEIYVPGYQRPLIWDDEMKSAFIESLILQLPIPYIFCCDTGDGRLEVVDGSQRLRTIDTFLKDDFKLQGLEKLDALNGYTFSDLPLAQQRKLRNRPIRMIQLSERSDSSTRFDIFHRLNSFGKQLTDAQIRKGAFPGPFYMLVEECAASSLFVSITPVDRKRDPRGEREELALRFFAFSARYHDFKHDVAKFLNQFIVEMNNTPFDRDALLSAFNETMRFVDENFPTGFTKKDGARQVPRVRFEAIAVGTFLALQTRSPLQVSDFSWLESEEFQQLVRTDASNSSVKLRARIEYVRDQLLAAR